MKKLICLILCLGLIFALAGCRRNTPDHGGHNESTGSTKGSAPGNTNAAVQELIAVSVPSVTEEVTAEDGTVLFQYTYQHMSLVLNKPEVADKIILDFLNRVDSTKQASDDTAATAKNTYTGNANWVPYLYHITYSPTRIDQSVLSLFGNNVVYNGATHPDRTCVSASYDLETGDVLTLASIMDMNGSVEDLCNLVLDGLSDMAEGDYLYESYRQTVQHRFDVDASTDEAWYFTQTGLCFYFAPYEIAPYASGVITVEIPYEKLTELLHEAYLPAVRGDMLQGNISVTPFADADLNTPSDMAEIVMDKQGTMLMLRSDSTVQDIRIILSDDASNYTVFAANVLSPENGIAVQANADQLSRMKLSYRSGNETVSKPLQ